ncbi:TraB/GumN family protein [Bowmanella dokdonensis]|uniref:TraB/GumN family protein n=1 Tax=Bowmanella dokdonensis TaxID=751969 RepID=A0A939DR85_9ALTE|nr:TraB/GumN family protein [Bowmanella dokdonensis]MBN7826750.1 TraB/GumN family protein [Bowmanella dokdonensis]
MKAVTVFLVSISILFSNTVRAEGPVWKISKGDSHLYLAGTLHLLTRQDYPLPSGFDRAYQEAGTLVFETDLRSFSEPSFQQQMMQRMQLPEGKTLSDVLGSETLQSLQAHLDSRQLPYASVARFKISFLVLTLSMLEMRRLGFDQQGVDQFYLEQAHRENKNLGFLETPEQQLAYLLSLGEGQKEAWVKYTLEELQELPTILTSLQEAWRQADLDALDDQGLRPMKEDYPELYQTLMVDRNQLWLPQLRQMLDTPQVELVLVGALHLVGEVGLLAELSDLGYQVEKI